jgi:CheY-like chemotaxis protein
MEVATMADNSQRGTVLVVDDNADIRVLAKVFLENAGYAVVMARDGVEGFRAYQEHRASILMLLTDVEMPNMGGLELSHRVLEMDSQIAVLLMSGDAGCDYRELECLAKPFRPAELVETVSRVLHTKTHSERASSAA